MHAETPTTASASSVASDQADRVRAAGRWSVVPTASQASFSVRDKLVTTVHGSLPVEDGGVVLADRGDAAEAWVSLALPGIATGNARRDRDLQQPRFLGASAWPSIRVEALTVTATRTGWTAGAVVHARGHRAPVDLTVETIAKPTDGSDSEVRIRVTGRLDRSPLGIGAPTFIIGRFLDLEADLTFRRSAASDNSCPRAVPS